MARIKFSKRQIAGVLLLSSTAIGATASGTASANAFTKFIGSKVSHAYNWVTDSTVGKVVGIVGIVGITAILLAVARVPYRIRKLRFKYYSNLLNSISKQLSNATKKLISEIGKDLETEASENLNEEVNKKNKKIFKLLKDFKDNIEAGKRESADSNFRDLELEFTNFYSNKRKQLFDEIEKEYVTYTKYYDYLNIKEKNK